MALTMDTGNVSASDWAKGIGLSVLASLIGGASKLAIRKSWLLQHEHEIESSFAVSTAEKDTTDETDIPSTSLTLETPSFPQVAIAAPSPAVVSRCAYLLLRYSGMFGMSVLNPVCCVLAMNYASPSILAPFSGLTLVWVILFSAPVVGERPSIPQVVAACLIIAGEVIVAIFGDHTNDEGVTVADVKQSYKAPDFIAFFVGLALYLALLAYWMLMSKNPILRRFAWGSSGGAITGAQNFLKDSLTIIKATEKGEHYPWFFYLFLVMAGASAFIGLLFLTACMKRYDATYSASSFVGSFVISASIMSAIHYHTFATLENMWNYILYPTGLVVLGIGAYMLVRGSEEDELEDVFETGSTSRARKDSEDSQLPFMYNIVDDAEEQQRVV